MASSAGTFFFTTCLPLFKPNNDGASIYGVEFSPDNSILYASGTLNANTINGTLASINEPNVAGLGCNYQDQTVSLGGMKGSFSLPSFISGFDYSNKLIQCSQSMSLYENTSKDLLIFPNPTDGVFKIQTKKTHKQYFDLFDLNGSIVLSGFFVEKAEFNGTRIDAGVYILVIRDDNSVSRHKLIIVK